MLHQLRRRASLGVLLATLPLHMLHQFRRRASLGVLLATL